jgi:hypothetical protein
MDSPETLQFRLLTKAKSYQYAKWVGFIIATNAAPHNPTSPIYLLFVVDRKKNEWGGRVWTCIHNLQRPPMTESSAKKINASVHLPQRCGPKVAMI